MYIDYTLHIFLKFWNPAQGKYCNVSNLCTMYINYSIVEKWVEVGYIILVKKSWWLLIGPNTLKKYYLKPNYFKKQHSSTSFLLTWSRYKGPKWSWNLSRLVPYLKLMELCCLVLLCHFGPAYLLQVSKNDDEVCCF